MIKKTLQGEYYEFAYKMIEYSDKKRINISFTNMKI